MDEDTDNLTIRSKYSNKAKFLEIYEFFFIFSFSEAAAIPLSLNKPPH